MQTTPTSVTPTLEPTMKPHLPGLLLWTLVCASIGTTILIIFIVVGVVCYCQHAKKDFAMSPMLPLESKDLNIFKYLEPEDDGWEIPRGILNVQEDRMLGSGCFGEVCYGAVEIQYIQTKKRLTHQYSLHLKSSAPEAIPVAIKKLKSKLLLRTTTMTLLCCREC